MSVWTEIKSAVGEFLPEKRSFGKRGERAAERFLKKRGMKIVAAGYSNHIGEIDLVAVEKTRTEKTVVFVEVKTRGSDAQGLPVEAVDQHKQRQIVQTALVFLRQHELLESRFRFDIVSVMWPEDVRHPEITHFPDAFQPAGQGQLFT